MNIAMMLIMRNEFDNKKRLRIQLKWLYRAKCNAHSQYSFYKILNLFLSDLRHQIKQKNSFFFIKKILLKIFNELNAMTIRWRMLFWIAIVLNSNVFFIFIQEILKFSILIIFKWFQRNWTYYCDYFKH